MSNLKLSVCMIVKNEEKFIEDCLKSVQPVADQMVVVDTGSTDGTIEIAKRFGAEVHSFRWIDDFSAARNASLKYARGQWILWLDADERLMPESIPVLKDLLRPERKAVAYLVYIKNIMADGKNFKISTGHRLFNNFKGIRFQGRIHEQIIYSVARNKGEERRSNIYLFHLGYGLSPEKQEQKNERNRRLLLQMVGDEPHNAYAHFTLGQNYLLSNDLQNALKHYLKALSLKGLDRSLHVNVLNTTAETYLKLGDLQKAEQYARQSLQLAPQQVAAYYLMYRIAYAAHKPQEAVQRLQKLLEMNRKSDQMQRDVSTDIMLDETDILITLADLLAEIGQVDEGVSYWYQALQKAPDNWAVLKRFLNFLLKTKRWQEALNLIDSRPIEQDPALLDIKGMLQIKQQDFVGAIQSYARLLQLKPENTEIVRRLAGLFLKIGQAEKAERLMQMLEILEQARAVV